jgi:hypothetical protein
MKEEWENSFGLSSGGRFPVSLNELIDVLENFTNLKVAALFVLGNQVGRIGLPQVKQHLGLPFTADDPHGQLKTAPEFHVPRFFYIALIGRTITIAQRGKSDMVA